MNPPATFETTNAHQMPGGPIASAWFRRGSWRDGDVRGTPGAGPDPDPEDADPVSDD